MASEPLHVDFSSHTRKLSIAMLLNPYHLLWYLWRRAFRSTNMEDLREKTHTEHYEIFRRRRLQEMGFADKGADNQPVR